MNKKVYISGKISGKTIEQAILDFDVAEQFLINGGNIPVNPIKVVPFNKDYKWEDYMKGDLKAMLDCDMVYMLNDWKESKGATIEHMIATVLRIDILYEAQSQSVASSLNIVYDDQC